MELIEYPIQKVARFGMGWAKVLLVPTGDWQYGADGFWESGLREYLRECVVEANGAPIILIGTGDMADRNSPSNRQRVRSAGFYDSVLDALQNEAERDVAGILKIIRDEIPEGNWIGMVEGHHYFEFDDGTTTDTRLCHELGATFLGDCAIVQLKFAKDEHTSKIVNIWVHHGQGVQHPIIKLKKLSAVMEGIDLFLMGHTPYIEAGVEGRMFPTASGKLKHRDIRLAGTGGWLRGYTQNSRRNGRAQGNYIEQGMMAACPLGGIKIWLKPWKNQHGAGVKIEVVV